MVVEDPKTEDTERRDQMIMLRLTPAEMEIVERVAAEKRWKKTLVARVALEEYLEKYGGS